MRLQCEGCGRIVIAGPDCPEPFTCPAATPGDDIDHLLVADSVPLVVDASTDRTFLRFARSLASAQLPLDASAFRALVERLDDAIAEVAGTGFTVTPLTEHDLLGVTLAIKDETHNVAGSHKARHLMGILLWLETTEALGWVTRRRPLAIASCGNAALAAAVLARATDRTLDVFIPEHADPDVVARLDALGAHVHRCARQPGEQGDPTWRRFLDRVRAGSVPFCCQGPANGLTLDGGRTLAWELGDRRFDDVVVQVGGGALASSFVRGLEDLPCRPRVHLVQTLQVAPLTRAVRRVAARGPDLAASLRWAATHRSAVMWPWERSAEPTSAATGILDDETYDWHRLVRAVLESEGGTVNVDEATLVGARDTLERAAGVRASVTGASGLAGLIELRRTERIAPGARVLVIATGRSR